MRRLICCFALLICLVATIDGTIAADDVAPSPSPKFELRDGDRVVFLGNTLIERAQKYGYWETMLTARYPDRDITFRNLGWSGDTVWAESRGIFDPPAVGYKRMIEHVGRLKPTVIFVGYGNNEAFAGKAGLPAFIKQYNKLLDDLTAVSAKGVRFVILSPAFVAATRPPLPNHELQHLNRTLYRDRLRETAKTRNLHFVDLLSEMERCRLSEEWCGVYADLVIDWKDLQPHLSENSIALIAGIVRATLIDANGEQLFSPDLAGIGFKADGEIYARSHVTLAYVKQTEQGLLAKLASPLLGNAASGLSLGISGLAPGKYEVRIDGKVWNTVNHVKLHKGINVERNDEATEPDSHKGQGPNASQWEKLRNTIIEKNRLYFYRWRPQNITYLFGFRKHEQGQNAKELAEFDKLIAAKEAEINKLKKPVPHTYEIIRVKEDKKP